MYCYKTTPQGTYAHLWWMEHDIKKEMAEIDVWQNEWDREGLPMTEALLDEIMSKRAKRHALGVRLNEIRDDMRLYE